MISLEQAQQEVRSRARPLPEEVLDLRAAAGRVLARAIESTRDLPGTDISMMDGYAVRAADASLTLRVVAEIPAGAPPRSQPLERGEAARIFTGAPIPPGTDSVVMQEHAERIGAELRIREPTKAGQHIRRRGEETRRGQVVVPAGAALGPAELSLAAASGSPRVFVHRRPRVAVLTTGDELVPVGSEPPPGKLVETNSVALEQYALQAAAQPVLLGIAPDDVGQIAQRLRDVEAEVLVTTGGASVGDHDHAQDAFARLGGELVFHTVAIRPGKPVLFGVASGGRLVFGLPGNPAAAMLGFELFVRLALRILSGDPRPERPAVRAVLRGGALAQIPGLVFFPRGRATVEGSRIAFTPGGAQSSMQIGSWSAVNALGRIPPGDAKLNPGDELDVVLLGPPEAAAP
jgi:molybdopterin molybdotransferase